jgi:hypothetical protein
VLSTDVAAAKAAVLRRRSLPSRLVAGGLASGLALLVIGLPTPATADAAPGFERVTPSGKGGGAVAIWDSFRTNDDGSRLLLTTTGAFTSVPTDSVPLLTRYLAERGSESWGLTATDAATDPITPTSNSIVMSTLASSEDLSHVLVASTKALAPGAIAGGGNLYVRNTATRAFTLVAASSDPQFAREFLNNQGNFAARFVANDGRSAIFDSPYLDHPDAPPGGFVGYRWTADEGLEIATVLPDGTPVNGYTVNRGDEAGPRESRPTSGAPDRVYFFDTGAGGGAVYLREGDDTTLVSQSRVGGPSGVPVPAQLLATSSDSRYALFATVGPHNDPLSSDVPPSAISGSPSILVFYRYDAVLDELRYVGHGWDYIPAPIIGMSDDAQTIAFRSTEELAPGAVAGQLNTFVWKDGSLQTAHVREAWLSSSAAPEMLWSLSPNGRYLVFSDESPSTAAQFGLDNTGLICGPFGAPGNCRQVYRFDSEASDPADALECVSCRTDGESPRGDAGDPTNPYPGYIRMDTHQMRMALDDGRVLFTSPDDLVAADGNGLPDVYEYEDGVRTLLTRASADHGSRLLDTTPDGSSVFISTTDRIARADVDSSLDIYVLRPDARPEKVIDTGQGPCSGSDCRSLAPPLGPQPPAPSRYVPPQTPVKAKKTVRPRVVSTRIGRDGKIRLRVKAPEASRIVISGGGVNRVERRVAGGKTYQVRTSLTARQRAKVRRSRKAVRINIRVSVSPNFGSTRVIRVARRAGV